jgi:prevent-host-death family protein
MDVAVSDAKAQLTDLVRRAEAGEEIVLTRFGRAIVRLAPITAKPSAAESLKIIEEIQAAGRAAILPGPDAAHSQDFLYDDATGLPL